ELNQKLMDEVNKTGEIFITHTKLNDTFVLRLVISGLRTEERHVRKGWEILKDKLKEISLGAFIG
ncbi:MAG: amino acid decarboxylase, partial [Ignavibacteriales bacterium]|nr:amino acid decarboxylase [Ignavibacteriales bacterium]